MSSHRQTWQFCCTLLWGAAAMALDQSCRVQCNPCTPCGQVVHVHNDEDAEYLQKASNLAYNVVNCVVQHSRGLLRFGHKTLPPARLTKTCSLLHRHLSPKQWRRCVVDPWSSAATVTRANGSPGNSEASTNRTESAIRYCRAKAHQPKTLDDMDLACHMPNHKMHVHQFGPRPGERHPRNAQPGSAIYPWRNGQ